MQNPLWRVAVVIFCSVLYGTGTGAATRNGIRMWRDRNGIMNITNIHSAPKKSTAFTKTKLISPPNPVSMNTNPIVTAPQPFIPSRSTSIARSMYNNIYTYTDKSGIKHFTNIPSVEQPYQLVLQTSFTKPSSIPLRRTTRRSDYDNIVAAAARTYQVDQSLIRAMIHVESAFNPLAVSPKGATGLMQLMPDTARRYGVQDAFNPTENVYGGVRYLRNLLDMFDNNLHLAIAAYNAGENAVTRYGGIPPYAETTDYVQRVLSLHSQYRNTN